MAAACLAYGVGGHDCATHPDALSVVPEPCTTWSYRLRHLSIDLTAARMGMGRTGYPLCDDTGAYDQDAMNDVFARWGNTPKKQIGDLRPCLKCAKKAQRAGVVL